MNTGQYNGLAARVKSKCPQALLTICYAHKLNLVLQDSVKNIKQCKIFFMTVSGFASFFSKSSKRNYALDQIVNARFPAVAPTRWLYNNRLVEMIYSHKQELIQLFDYFLENVTVFDPETRFCAKGFRKNLLDFEFNFLLEIFHSILPKAEILFKVIQKRTCDIIFCEERIEEFKQFVRRLRNEFEVLWANINNSESQYSDVKYNRKRQRTENTEDDTKTSYRRLYFEIMDNFMVHVEERFTDFHHLQFFSILNFHNFEEY